MRSSKKIRKTTKNVKRWPYFIVKASGERSCCYLNGPLSLKSFFEWCFSAHNPPQAPIRLQIPKKKSSSTTFTDKSNTTQRSKVVKRHRNWSVEKWRKVMFSDESNFLQFRCFKNFIQRPLGSSSMDPLYCQPTVRHPPPSVMAWACFSSKGRGGLYFLEKGKTMNGERYQQVLNDHLLNFMALHGCTTFMHDSAPCHRSKQVTK